MKLTQMVDGRWFLEIEDIASPLEAFQVAQLADLLNETFYAETPLDELARLQAELAKYKATRATGGPWRPADQTWVSADIEPPASASDDTAPPLFRGLTVDKKETAL